MINTLLHQSYVYKSDRSNSSNHTFLGVFAFVLLITFDLTLAMAQQPRKIPRVGLLAGTKPAAVAARIEAFRQGLRELGYVEGKNIVADYRYAEGEAQRERELAAELVRRKFDVIVAAGPTVTRTLKH